MDSTVPYARDEAGNIYSTTGRYSLVPDGAERTGEVYYTMGFGHGSRFGTHLLYRDEPLHATDSARERVVMFTVDWVF